MQTPDEDTDWIFGEGESSTLDEHGRTGPSDSLRNSDYSEEKPHLKSESFRRMDDIARVSRRLECSPPDPDGSNWGVPDWRNADAYPRLGDLDQFEWWWEFLRRNHGYRKDYLWFDEYIGANQESYFEYIYGLRRVSDPSMGVLDFRLKAEEWGNKPGEDLFNLYHFHIQVPFIEADISNFYFESYKFEEFQLLRYRDNVAVCVIQLDRALKPQFLWMKKQATKTQKNWFKKKKNPQIHAHKGQWPRYLRVLDASDAGATLSEISEVFLLHDDVQRDAALKVVQAAEVYRRYWRVNYSDS